jgi:hypothetical protein
MVPTGDPVSVGIGVAAGTARFAGVTTRTGPMIDPRWIRWFHVGCRRFEGLLWRRFDDFTIVS